MLYVIVFFNFLAIFPILSNSSGIFTKVNIDEFYNKNYIDKFYHNYVDSGNATLYFLDWCWKTKDRISSYDICKNDGLKFTSISMPNPRILNGKAYSISLRLSNQEYPENLNNLKVIYNLKNIIIPEDLNFS